MYKGTLEDVIKSMYRIEKKLDPVNPKAVKKDFDNRKDTDEWALSNRYVSIVPVQFDLTSFDSLTKLKSWNL